MDSWLETHQDDLDDPMRLFLAVIACAVFAIGGATAAPVPVARDGIWTAFDDVTSEQKVCAVQADNAQGSLTLFARSDQSNTLRLTLKNPAWHLARIPESIVISFAGGDSIGIVGAADGAFIRAGIPDGLVRELIHHLTADQTAMLTLPNIQGQPWSLDLHGSTPTVEAMAECLAIAHLWLPPPFRQASSDGGTPGASFVEPPIAAPPSTATAALPSAAPPATPQRSVPDDAPNANAADAPAPSPPTPGVGASACKDDWRACGNDEHASSWYAFDINGTRCIQTHSPAAKIRELQEGGHKVSTQDFGDSLEPSKVEVSYQDEEDVDREIIFTFYRSQAACEADLPINHSVPGKYE